MTANVNTSRDTANDPVGIFLVIVSSLSVAILPNSAKMVFEDGTGAMFLLMGRGLVGVVLLTALLVLMRSSFVLPRRLWGLSAWSGVLGLGFVATLYLSINYIDIGQTILILYLYPVVIALISHFRGTARLNTKQWLAILSVVLGMALLFQSGKGAVSPLGIALSLMAMSCTVAIVFVSGHLTDEIGAGPTNFYMNLWSVLLLLALYPFVDGWAAPETGSGWTALGFNGFCYVLVWVTFFAGAKRIGLMRASLLTSVDPLFAALIALFLFGEVLLLPQWIGFGVVLLALFFFEYTKDRPAAEPADG